MTKKNNQNKKNQQQKKKRDPNVIYNGSEKSISNTPSTVSNTVANDNNKKRDDLSYVFEGSNFSNYMQENLKNDSEGFIKKILEECENQAEDFGIDPETFTKIFLPKSTKGPP
ncbi:hypothetical protein DICPUDRAFT_152078 [Dictyostelium purpureum]|uniref:Uncharacterized protein n=1 Tax=Dictyostelium purpureum TaxID=5786 RepID=F0ZKF2_DICPU|nr:uncharacterized protein DICPUDRAFT_152078 [Dictyostelium purpureum]EGC35598.1 hypothetical protein DICPUDRAFT_152078 [Dictyostelium purpureum]|eukprot:XP_003287901.1 hypothetical protein DICPUDRAFT_152078 [Dictyostelium purpureum]